MPKFIDLKKHFSFLVFQPKKIYNHLKVRCIVEHPALPGGRWTGTRELNVQFKPKIVKIYKKNY